MGFKEDLKSGEDVEMEILSILQKEFPEAKKETDKSLREYYDIIVPKKDEIIKIEIKADIYKSSNFAIECLGRGGKITGLLKTRSDLWIQCRKNKYFIWKTSILRKYMLNIGGCLKSCGDDKAFSAWIISEEKLLKECPPLFILDKKDKKLCSCV